MADERPIICLDTNSKPVREGDTVFVAGPQVHADVIWDETLLQWHLNFFPFVKVPLWRLRDRIVLKKDEEPAGTEGTT